MKQSFNIVKKYHILNFEIILNRTEIKYLDCDTQNATFRNSKNKLYTYENNSRIFIGRIYFMK